MKSMKSSLGGYKINGSVPYSLWKVKNHEEMREYIIEEHPQLCINDAFIDALATLELENLIAYKIKCAKYCLTMEKSKDIQHSA
jgi:dTDP-4-dehydrorhamnose reductase